jgi:CheY-like chemotaxis protein
MPTTTNAAAPTSTAADHGHATLRVLCVEDHADTLSTMCKLLSRSGYLVTAAGSVAEARRLMAACIEPFDVLLADVELPDGSALTLMNHPSGPRPRVGIVLSGYGMAEDIARSTAACFADHLIKPVLFENLQKSIAAALAASLPIQPRQSTRMDVPPKLPRPLPPLTSTASRTARAV